MPLKFYSAMSGKLYRPQKAPTETTTLNALASALHIHPAIVHGLHQRRVIMPVGVKDGLLLFDKHKATQWLRFSGDLQESPGSV